MVCPDVFIDVPYRHSRNLLESQPDAMCKRVCSFSAFFTEFEADTLSSVFIAESGIHSFAPFIDDMVFAHGTTTSLRVALVDDTGALLFGA
jgi:hypothetical protein